MIEDELAGSDQKMIEDELAGPDGNMNEDEPAGPDGNVTEAGQGDLVQDVGAGPDQNMIEDELAGPNGNEIEDEPEEQDDVNSYPLANPGLVEAPDDGTVVQHTGAARSVPGTTTGRDLPHSQNPHGKCQGSKKRMASDTGGSTGGRRDEACNFRTF